MHQLSPTVTNYRIRWMQDIARLSRPWPMAPVDAPTRLRRVRMCQTFLYSCHLLPYFELQCPEVGTIFLRCAQGVDGWPLIRFPCQYKIFFIVDRRIGPITIGPPPWARVEGQVAFAKLLPVKHSMDELPHHEWLRHLSKSLVLKLCQGSSSSGCWGCDNPLFEERFRNAMKKTLYIPVRFNQHKQHNQHNQKTCVYVGDNSTSKNIKNQSNSTPAAWLSPWQKRCGPGGAQESPRQRFLCRDSDPGVVLGMDGFSILFPNHWVYNGIYYKYIAHLFQFV